MWVQSYEIVPLAAMLSESRATRVSVRRVHDVVFPEVVSFPLRQRLNYFGAFEDVTLPSPHVSDESEVFNVVSGEDGVDDALEYDGLVRENRPSFRRTRVTEVACAFEPDTTPEADGHVNDQPGAIVAVEDGAVQPQAADPDCQAEGVSAEEAKEIPLLHPDGGETISARTASFAGPCTRHPGRYVPRI